MIVRMSHAPKPSFRCLSIGLLEQTPEMALVRKAAIVGDFGDRAAIAHHAPRQIQSPKSEVPVRTGAERGAKIPRQLPATMARRALHFCKREAPEEIVLDVIARSDGRFTIRPLDGNGGTRGRLQRSGQIVERVLLLKSRQRPLVVSQKGCDSSMQTRVNRNAAFNERQRLAVQYFLNISWGDVGRAIAKDLIVAGTAIMSFVGVQDYDLAGKRGSFSAAISEALNAAKRDADCIGVVAVRSVRRTGKASFNTADVSGGLEKPVFARLSHFEPAVIPVALIGRVSSAERRVNARP